MIRASFHLEMPCAWRINDDTLLKYGRGEIFMTSLVDLHHEILEDSRVQCSRRHIDLFGTCAGIDEKIWHIHMTLHAGDILTLLVMHGVPQVARRKKGVGVLMLTREEVASVSQLLKTEEGEDDSESAVSLSFYESPAGLEVGGNRHKGRPPLWQAGGIAGFDVQLPLHIPWRVIWTIGSPDQTAEDVLGPQSSIKITDTGKTTRMMPGLVRASPIEMIFRDPP